LKDDKTDCVCSAGTTNRASATDCTCASGKYSNYSGDAKAVAYKETCDQTDCAVSDTAA